MGYSPEAVCYAIVPNTAALDQKTQQGITSKFRAAPPSKGMTAIATDVSPTINTADHNHWPFSLLWGVSTRSATISWRPKEPSFAYPHLLKMSTRHRQNMMMVYSYIFCIPWSKRLMEVNKPLEYDTSVIKGSKDDRQGHVFLLLLDLWHWLSVHGVEERKSMWSMWSIASIRYNVLKRDVLSDGSKLEQ